MSFVSQKQMNENNQLCSDANDDVAEKMIELKKHIVGNIIKEGTVVPRFGLLSLKASSTPMYVYDHPAFMKITNTAFTDGVHIFVCANFLRKLFQEDENTKSNEEGVLPFIISGLTHMVLNQSDMHTITLKDLIETLEKNGLENVLEDLELPSSENKDEIAKIEKNTLLKDIEYIEKAAAQKNSLGVKYPESQIVEAAVERVNAMKEGDIVGLTTNELSLSLNTRNKLR